MVTRIVAQKLSDQLGRQVVAENRGGAGGIVGSEAVAKAAPDGYTLVMGTTGTHAINASLYPKLSYDPLKDFALVTRTALLGGEVALSFATVVSSLPHVKAGKLRGLAVTSAKRTPAAPEFPTVAESGLRGYEAVAWYGVLAPAGTPREIVMRLNGEIVRARKLPDVQQLLLAQGAEPVSDTPEQFAAIIKADIAKWGEVVRKSGAKAD